MIDFKCCYNCGRRVDIVDTVPFVLYCMAFQKHVDPFNVCKWHFPMDGYEIKKKEDSE